MTRIGINGFGRIGRNVLRALLERSERGVEQIAAEAGLGTGANLRLHFQRILGTTPSEYRRTFARGE